MLLGGLAAAAGTSLGLDVRPALAACAPVARVLEPKPERAVSLKAMSRALAKGPGGNPNYASLLRMGGITRLDGYVADESANDLILFGIVERDAPPLDFRDFVVALRNAHFFFGRVRDNDFYGMQPAISIDSDPKIFLALQKIDLLKSGKRQKAKAMSAYRELCSSPQVVRVEGMPRACRAAKVLVDADYLMKRVSNGTHIIPIDDPFEGSWPAQRQANALRVSDGLKMLPGSNTRYWFEPKLFKYDHQPDAGTVFITTAQVVLLDEAEKHEGGELVASGRINPFARDFTCAWSDRMEDVYRAEPIWRDMHNVYRHFALARIMADRTALSNVGFDSTTLLQNFETRSEGPPDTLPGISEIVYDKVNRSNLVFSVCGGVSARFNKDNLQVDPKANTEQTKRSGQAVLASRPADEMQVAWNVDPSALLKPKPRPVAPAKAPPPTPTPSVKPTPPARKPTIEEIMKRRV
jgi:hypothetical protein